MISIAHGGRAISNVHGIEEPPREECAVCLSSMYPDRSITLENCAHTFCRSCINEWICEGDSTCPCCRAEFSDKDRMAGYYFGMVYGLITPIYEMVIDFDAMTAAEKFAFKYNFRRAAEQLGMGAVLENDCMLIESFKEIMHVLHTVAGGGAQSIILFNAKTKLQNVFLGYLKTRTYDEFLKNIKQKKELMIIVKNFFVTSI